ncbi:492_t:CDS:10 [Scutellospora calospora]|uniref:492_t:CDS:1 n=1 Tax=Scutellospora calospora TaxID=85575 RepID=A0ACA9JTM1_9GLOM|nr:492_t:CDS:10 [Scutellospora calospora]
MNSTTSNNDSRLRSASAFIDFLTKLEYPNVSTLQPEQILWAFESKETRCLLDWLCENIDVENNLIGINEGGLISTELAKIKKDHEGFENEIDILRKRNDHVSNHRDQLKLTLEDLESQLTDLKRINRDLDERNKNVDLLIQQESIKLDVETIALSCALSEVLSERDTHEESGNTKNFIFQCTNDIQDIVKIDQAFSYELERFCESLFPQNIDEIFDQKALRDEIKRLKSLCPKTELKYIEAITRREYMSVYLRTLENDALGIDSFIPDFNSLELRYEQYISDSSIMNQQIKSILTSRIEEYLKNLAELQIENPLLIADYTIQSKYQKSLIDRFNLVNDILLSQYARTQFISKALNLELDDQKAVHKLFSDVTNELEHRRNCVVGQKMLMSATDFVEPKVEKTVVESSDNLLLSMNRLTNLEMFQPRSSLKDLEGQSTPFITYESLKEKIAEINQTRNNLFSRVNEELDAQQEFTKSCEEIEQNLTSILYKDSKTMELLFTPRELSDIQVSLLSIANRLQPKLNQISQIWPRFILKYEIMKTQRKKLILTEESTFSLFPFGGGGRTGSFGGRKDASAPFQEL